MATPGGPALDVLTTDESLGGDGTPAVAAFTPETFALELGMSPAAGAAADRRRPGPAPPAPAAVETGGPAGGAGLAGPPGRPADPRACPWSGARWVDKRLAARTDGAVGPVITDRLVAQAIAKFDPEDQEQREAAASAAWDVTLCHPDPPTSPAPPTSARGDTLTLKSFHDLVCAIAHQLHLDGDTDPLGVRKIKAIGLITAAATGQTALDLPRARTAQQTGKIKLYVRVDAHDLDLDADGGAAFAVGTVESLGAATMAKLRQWVGHSQVVIQPVLNMHRRDAVDSHDPPRVDGRAGRCSATATASSPAAPSLPADATRTTWSPTSRSTKADHPARPTPTPSPACAGDTTAPKPRGSGGMPARPKATTSGTDPTARTLPRHP